MVPLVTAGEMRQCDSFAIDGVGIPGIVLMENAGKGVYDAIVRKYGNIKNKSILVVCGKGNNGGDGFVVARYLFNNGAHVEILLIGQTTKLTGDSKVNCEIIKKLIKIGRKKNNLTLKEFKNVGSLPKFNNFDIIIDAIFGTGFSGEVKGDYYLIIERINKARAFAVSIDIPSGVNADTGFIENIAVKSNLTVTMGLRKIGLTYGKSINYVNDLNVVDISLPPFHKWKNDSNVYLVEQSDIEAALPNRLKTAHKYSVGKVFVLAGSQGYTGAAAMASQSALRIGTGAVILGTPRSVYHILAKKLTEVMVNPINDTDEGSISIKSMDKIRKFIEWADVVVMGCGISLNPETYDVVWEILKSTQKPILIDADALTIISSDMQKFAKRKSTNVILTPHYGEFSRLVNLSISDIEKDPINITKSFARKYKLSLILKGAPTLTVSQNGFVIVNATGNPGMATAGSGDVLAGIVGGLWAQQMDDFSASYSGVYLHGLAGDIANKKLGERSLIATDILKNIPQAIKKIEYREEAFE